MRAAALLLALAVVAAAEEREGKGGGGGGLLIVGWRAPSLFDPPPSPSAKTFKSNGLALAGGRFVFPVASKLPDNGSFISVDLR